MVKVKLMLACIIVLDGVVINPQINELSVEDFAKVKNHKDFKALEKKGEIVILPNDDGSEPGNDVNDNEEVDINKMNKAQLIEYAKSKDIVITEGATKADIIAMIDLLDDEGDE